jgi:hypothetical protein
MTLWSYPEDADSTCTHSAMHKKSHPERDGQLLAGAYFENGEVKRDQAYIGMNAFSGSAIGPSPFQYGDSLRSCAMIGGIAAIT